jgi:hypothetical protein
MQECNSPRNSQSRLIQNHKDGERQVSPLPFRSACHMGWIDLFMPSKAHGRCRPKWKCGGCSYKRRERVESFRC